MFFTFGVLAENWVYLSPHCMVKQARKITYDLFVIDSLIQLSVVC